MKRNNGITLIALIITIVVLIILASVAITLSLGDNGIFKKAAKAKEDTLVAQNEEAMQIAEVTNSIDGIAGSSRDTVTVNKEQYEQLLLDVETLKENYENTPKFELYKSNSGSKTKTSGWTTLETFELPKGMYYIQATTGATSGYQGDYQLNLAGYGSSLIYSAGDYPTASTNFVTNIEQTQTFYLTLYQSAGSSKTWNYSYEIYKIK